MIEWNSSLESPGLLRSWTISRTTRRREALPGRRLLLALRASGAITDPSLATFQSPLPKPETRNPKPRHRDGRSRSDPSLALRAGIALLVLLFVSVPAWGANGAEQILERFVPAEAVAAWFFEPGPETSTQPQAGKVDQLATWLLALKMAGVVPREGRVVADVIGTLPLLARRPHAVVLLDVSARPLEEEDSFRVDDLQAALLFDSGPLTEAFDRRLRDLLASYTDSEQGRIETLDLGKLRGHRLIDRRLPEWAVIEWCNLGSFFVVTIGHGALTKILAVIDKRAGVLTDDPWLVRARARQGGSDGGIAVYVHCMQLRRRIEAIIPDRPTQVMRALHLETAEKVLYRFGYEGRALCGTKAVRELNGSERIRQLTEVSPAPEAAIIPDQATRYVVFHHPLAEKFQNVRGAYLASRSEDSRKAREYAWDWLEEKFQFNLQSDLLERLGEYLIIHDYPPHPLGLGVFRTICIQYRGPREPMAAAVDKLMAAWQWCLSAPADMQSLGLSPQLKRDDQGLWYFQLGLVGPAVAVTDGWVVISHSPQAVRDYLAWLDARDRVSGNQP